MFVAFGSDLCQMIVFQLSFLTIQTNECKVFLYFFFRLPSTFTLCPDNTLSQGREDNKE